MLQQVFDRQRELMNKYHEIEAKSGIFNYQDENVPVDIQSIAGQARIKHLAWYTVEEIAEALDGKTQEDQQEEFSDALHFFVELCIVSGYNSEVFGPLSSIFYRVKKFAVGTSHDFIARSTTRFIHALGNAMNRLKNKPWKQTPVSVDRAAYDAWILLSMYHLIEIAWALGIEKPQDLVDLYMGKAKINQQRQEDGY